MTRQHFTNGTKIIVGVGVSTVLADFDFETYSEAGFHWDDTLGKWLAPPGAKDKGLPSIGAAKYSEHPSAEILCMAYNLKDGKGPRQWRLGGPPPLDLFEYIKAGGLLEAWNAPFEHWVWVNVGQKKYGWPPLPYFQLRCAAAKARAHSLPSSLENAGLVLNIQHKKDKEGKRLISKFCIPRVPTLKNKSFRNPLDFSDEDTQKFYDYNLRDIEAESEASERIPDLCPSELEFWLCDRAINYRGVQVDLETIEDCIAIIRQAHKKYNPQIKKITNGAANVASEVSRLQKWIASRGVAITSLRSEEVTELLKSNTLPPDVRKVLEIREMIGASAVKKLFALKNYAASDGRLHDMFIYHAARTGRATGTGPQLQNLPNSGPDVNFCSYCKKYSRDIHTRVCCWCGASISFGELKEWNADAAQDALTAIKTRSLECVEFYWGDAIETVSGCLRGLLVPKKGHDLICSDYTAIEAVVLAALAGEEWRLEVFRTHGKIYEASASKITSVPFEEFIKHKDDTGQHHPLRKKIGKPAELASGFGGGLKGWKKFGAHKHLSEEEISAAVRAWRKASPAIVTMWGGQERNYKTEYYGVEGAAVLAVMHPGQEFFFKGISYKVVDNILYCKLLSGRHITYHKPLLEKRDASHWLRGFDLSYETWNSSQTRGGVGWIRVKTYGGQLTENIVQATARDILAHAIVKLEKSGYPVVLQIHDEIVCEVPEDFGSVEEMEKIMCDVPGWAKDWPIKAQDGWRGKRYRK